MDSTPLKYIQTYTSHKHLSSKKTHSISPDNSIPRRYQPHKKESPYHTIPNRTTELYRKSHKEYLPHQEPVTSTNYRSHKVSAHRPINTYSTDSSQEAEMIAEEDFSHKKIRSYKPSPSVSTHHKGQPRYQMDVVATAYKTPINKDNSLNTTSELHSKGNFTSMLKTTSEKANKRMNIERKEEEPEEKSERTMRIGAYGEDIPSSRKRYNLYEDWRILETVEHYIQEVGSQGIHSKNTWERMKDPKTKLVLLNGERSGESMRTRYRKFLINLTEKDKEELRKFVRDRTDHQLKLYSCFPIKEESKTSVLTSAKAAALKNTNTKKTLSFNSNRKKKTTEKLGPVNSQALTPHFEAIFEKENSIGDLRRERLIMQPNYIRRAESEESERDDSAEPLTARKIVSTGRVSVPKESLVHPNKVIVNHPAWKYPKEESGKKRLLHMSAYEEDLEENPKTISGYERKKAKEEIYRRPSPFPRVEQIQERSFTFNRKEFNQLEKSEEETESKENEPMADISRETVPLTSDPVLEQIYECQNIDFENVNWDIEIAVDYDNETREFLLPKEEEKAPQARIIRIANEYGLELNTVLKLFHAVSDDYEDLIKYLNTQDVELLWNPIDDKGLIFEDETAIYYLEKIKGKENVQKRMKYLIGRGENMQKVLAEGLMEEEI